jgi:hypothetical protein
MDAESKRKLSVPFTLHCKLKTKPFWSVGSIVLILLQAIRPLTQWCGFGPGRRCHHGPRPSTSPTSRSQIKKEEEKNLSRVTALLRPVAAAAFSSLSRRHQFLLSTCCTYRLAITFLLLPRRTRPQANKRGEDGKESPMLGRSTEAADQHKSEPHRMRMHFNRPGLRNLYHPQLQ